MARITTDANPRRRLPAEWEPVDAVLLGWPHKGTDWAYILEQAQYTVLDIARSIARHAPVILVGADLDPARKALSDLPVTYVDYLTNDTWTRDYGPITVQDSEGRWCINDYRFNGWGQKFPAERDNKVVQHLRSMGLLPQKTSFLDCQDFILEGGSIDSDGRGTILTTSRCLLSPFRNPDLTRQQIDARLKKDLGAKDVIWLEFGAMAGDDTDGHIDTLARFCPDGSILYCRQPSDPELCAMEKELTATGRRLRPLPLPSPIVDPDDGHPLPATYANFLAVNGAVLVPTYADPDSDAAALETIREAFPGYTVTGIDCRTLVRQNGSLHCMTMQLPSFFPAFPNYPR